MQEIFNHDFTACKDAADFHSYFLEHPLSLADLHKVCDFICAQTAAVGDKSIPAVVWIKSGNNAALPLAILAQLHGNEPAGLAGIALAMALAEARLLKQDVIGVVGNPVAAKQYFAHWAANPKARQEVRDAYRCGLAEDGSLLPDLNRIPVDFAKRPATNPHIRRAQELYHLGQHISGIADLHSARGNMICITDHKRDSDLKHSPIRSVLTELAEAISGHASGAVTVQTLKGILSPLPNIGCQIGIEAGRHEETYTPHVAASFTLSLLYTLGITSVKPLHAKETGVFERYAVQPRLTYASLAKTGRIKDDDEVFMVITCTSADAIPKQSDRVVVQKKDGSYEIQTILEFIINPAGSIAYAIYQYDEMMAIKKDQVVALALPSGVEFQAPHDFSGIFFSKSATLYDKDPAVGPWPVAADELANVKFCYPCKVSRMKIEF